MEITYWIVAGLLALLYLYSGGMKLLASQQKLAPMMAWAGTTVPMPMVRAIGAAEVLGAIGLILPPLLSILPFLAYAAAASLLILQIMAAGFHFSRDEKENLWLNGVLVVLAAVAIWLASAVV